MTEIELKAIPIADIFRLEKIIVNVASEYGLLPSLKCSLAKYPGCVHWHFKHERQNGTLEITFWPTKPRFWFKVQTGRAGIWMKEIIPQIKNEIETQVNAIND
ncbi:MAG: hypothetical protein ACREFE_09250 [Limisphaerales bacterium]